MLYRIVPRAKVAKLDVEQAGAYRYRNSAVWDYPKSAPKDSFNTSSAFLQILFQPNFSEEQPGEFLGVQFGTDFNVTGSINASQLLFDGSYLTGLKASKMYPRLSKENLQKIEMEIKAGVQSAYYNVIVAAEQIRILKATNNKNKQLIEDVRVYIDEGLSDSTTYDQLKLSIAQISAQEKRAERDLDLAKNALKLSMGYPLREDLQASEKLNSIIESLLASDAASFSVASHPDRQLLETQLELQRLNLDVKKKRLPTIGLELSSVIRYKHSVTILISSRTNHGTQPLCGESP